MMTIDQIKQAMKYAEGFLLGDFGELDIIYSGYQEPTNTPQFQKIIYPLFLQRVIDGMNRESPACIDQTSEEIEIVLGWNIQTFKYAKYGNIDQAKEACIIWVLENES